MNFRESLLDAVQHLFMPIDFEVRMQTALHQHACAAEFDRLANLFVNRVELENISFFRLRSLQRTIERAEGAVLGTEVRVINVAINDVSDYALGMQFAPGGIG